MNNKDKFAFWQKLRKSPVNLQYRYQRLVNHITGKILIGFEIESNGQINLILE